MLKLYQRILIQPNNGIARISCLTRHNTFASSTVAEVKNSNSENFPEKENSSAVTQRSTPKNRNNIVKVAFASINLANTSIGIDTPIIDKKIKSATSVDELLSLSQGTGVSRHHALKVVSVLSNWTSTGQIQLRDFETDPRFLRLCKILTKNSIISRSTKNLDTDASEDLSTILNITADEEAAKIVASITIPQMIKVLSTLSARRRRSPLLLRTIAYNVTASQDILNIKQCADLFYSISVLNYYDENLFERVGSNIITALQEQISKSAVVGSILTSIGLLKYKSPALLDAISEWVVNNQSSCRPQDMFSLFMTLGVLNYTPSNHEALFKLLIPQLTQEEAGKPLIWLDIVWSLVLLNKANKEHFQSVLSEEFISKLGELSTSVKLKLLNIDGAAHYLVDNYNGPKIPPKHEIRSTTLVSSKEKSNMINSVVETLKNLISENNLRSRVNTGLGFYIDAECLLDSTCNPQPLTSNPISEFSKIAVLAYDYHDMTKGKVEPTGINVFSQRLLNVMGYKVIIIPYTEFKVGDKIVNRVKYIEKKLKDAVKSS
ncbi:FAST kinase domain-containing protein 3, mitochondrial [Sitophilus oryzae]|uniref:FAST kinase domain-containing protein 3, mitochondrial n=1 Tax=Sitophilus oryzae TaxID=7048 RepID=A0A6J2Y0K8_SITOR|nr:FAST kinase domain-containing protein 3, mitochondrial [Sitophilus oryzae]